MIYTCIVFMIFMVISGSCADGLVVMLMVHKVGTPLLWVGDDAEVAVGVAEPRPPVLQLAHDRAEADVVGDDHGRVQRLEVQHDHRVCVELAARLHDQRDHLHRRLLLALAGGGTDCDKTVFVGDFNQTRFHSVLGPSRDYRVKVDTV